MTTEAHSTPPPQWVSILRAVVALSLAAFILGAPVYRQVLDGKNRTIPRWQMFSGKGLGYYSLRFFAVTPEKGRHEVDWELVFPREIPERPPMKVNRVRDERALQALSMRVCRRLGPKAELYVEARRAVKSGWRRIGDPKKNACERLRRGRKKRRSGKKGARRGR